MQRTFLRRKPPVQRVINLHIPIRIRLFLLHLRPVDVHYSPLMVRRSSLRRKKALQVCSEGRVSLYRLRVRLGRCASCSEEYGGGGVAEKNVRGEGERFEGEKGVVEESESGDEGSEGLERLRFSAIAVSDRQERRTDLG
ncbi:hypothetical protein ANO11243_074920 [Dothideomycetidae sp. 11243]|nr:hypothetical protein ANO11243_074920 [fungal sp. No.11243]